LFIATFFSLFFLFGSAVTSVLLAYVILITKTKRSYTLRTILWPFKKKHTFLQNIGELIVNPFGWTIILIAIFLMLLLTLFNALLTDGWLGFISYFFSGIAAYFFSTLYLLILYYADLAEREPPHFIISLFFWGVAAALFSIIFSGLSELILGLVLPEVCLLFFATVFIAPVIEELFKLIGVLFVVFTPEVDNALDGALYGGAVGLGFAFIENWIYSTSQGISDSMSWVTLILLRGFLSTLGHMVFTGTTGAVLAWSKFKFKYWYILFVPILMIGILLHGIYNSTTFIDSIFAVVTGISLPMFVTMFLFFILFSFMLFYIISALSQWRKKKNA